MGRPDRVAVPGLPVDGPPGVAVHRIVPDQVDRAIGGHVVEQEPGQGAPEPHPGPGGAGEHPSVVGRVPRREVAEGAEEVGHGPPAGRQDGPDQQRREPLVGRAGELEP